MMDMIKFLAVISSFILMVCLVLALTSLVSLRHAVAESTAAQAEAQSVVDGLNDYLEQLRAEEDPSEPTLPAGASPESPLGDKLLVREINGYVGVYSSDGYMIRLLDVRVDSLPKREREALAVGIEVASWEALEALLLDYTA